MQSFNASRNSKGHLTSQYFLLYIQLFLFQSALPENVKTFFLFISLLIFFAFFYSSLFFFFFSSLFFLPFLLILFFLLFKHECALKTE